VATGVLERFRFTFFCFSARVPVGIIILLPHIEEQSLVQHVASFEEWRALASAWPLKQLVAIWNDLPGALPVQKFTNREIALERIWRSVHGLEGKAEPFTRTEESVPGRIESGWPCIRRNTITTASRCGLSKLERSLPH